MLIFLRFLMEECSGEKQGWPQTETNETRADYICTLADNAFFKISFCRAPIYCNNKIVSDIRIVHKLCANIMSSAILFYFNFSISICANSEASLSLEFPFQSRKQNNKVYMEIYKSNFNYNWYFYRPESERLFYCNFNKEFYWNWLYFINLFYLISVKHYSKSIIKSINKSNIIALYQDLIIRNYILTCWRTSWTSPEEREDFSLK